jgi:hypothetical protein
MKTTDQLIMVNVSVANQTKYSDIIDMRSMLGCTIDLVYTGSSLQGTAAPEYSMDGVTFRALPDSGSTAKHTIVAAGSNATWSIADYFYPYIRLAVTTTDSDAATCNARIFAKGV